LTCQYTVIPDPKNLLRDVDRLLREVESLAQRLEPSLREARLKVEAVECLRKGLAAFGALETDSPLTAEVGALRARLTTVAERLRGAMAPDGLDAEESSRAEPPAADAERLPVTIASAPSSLTPAVESPGTEEGDAAAAVKPDSDTKLDNDTKLDHGASPPANGSQHRNGGAHGAETRGLHSLLHGELPPVGSRIPLPGRHGARPGMPGLTPAAHVQPPDPEDLEKIRVLEEECEREFAKLPFAGDEERHCLLTLCAAKARRLRPKLRDSYAVDRRLGELIRRIVDLKRRYRLGWIDGCERNFDVPDWDAYVERCEEQLRELRVRDQARHDEARVARERAGAIAGEVDRRGRELRHYLDTEEGLRGTEPEKLRAVLMSYLAVEGGLDGDLLERLRSHKHLFTGIAFRRVRKALERAAGAPPAVDEETQRIRDRVVHRMRGCRAVLFAAPGSEEARRRIEMGLVLDRLVWLDMGTLDASAWSEFGRQVQLNEVHWVLRAPSNSSDAVSPWSEDQLREMLRKGNARLVDVDRIDDLEGLLGSIDRALASDATRA
jgi:hypothetical protein